MVIVRLLVEIGFKMRVKGLGVMLYMLGLSYGATSLALEALGVYMCKTSVYDAVQVAAEKVPGLKRNEVFAGLWPPALGGDLTSVKCNGEWLSQGIYSRPLPTFERSHVVASLGGPVMGFQHNAIGGISHTEKTTESQRAHLRRTF